MSERAYEYQSAAVGARSNAISGRSQAPALDYRGLDGEILSVKFDGVDGDQLLDRKIAVHTGAKTRELARRQSEALRQHGLSGVWELPSLAEANRARQLFAEEGIDNIVVMVTPP
jgi:filamentous hemagglutinin